MFTPRAARTAGLLLAGAALAAVLSSCGSDADTPAGSTPAGSAASSPASLTTTLLAVNDRFAAQTEYVLETSTADGTNSHEVHRGDAVSVDETSDYGHFEAVRVGDDVWVRIDNADLWRLELGTAFANGGIDPAPLVGHWVLVTGTQVARSGVPTGPPSPVFKHPDDTTAGEHAAVQGVDTVTYTDPVSLTTVYLSTDAEPLPVKVESGAEATLSVARYSRYGNAPAVEPPDPAGVIDGTELLPR